MSKELELRYFSLLLTEGSLSWSRLPGSIQRGNTLNELIQAGLLSIERKGAGKVLTVSTPVDFESFLNQRFPGRKLSSGGTAISNQRRYRDSKGSTRASQGLVILRGWKTILVNGHAIDLAAATDQFGGFACFKPSMEVDRLCTVENLACFTSVEAVLGYDRVYAHPYGRLGKQTFQALTTNDFLHFGDWDYTGLDEYLRLREQFAQTRFYVPENLTELWSRYSKPLKKQAVITKRLKSTEDPTLLPILDLLGRTNHFLEQEAVFPHQNSQA